MTEYAVPAPVDAIAVGPNGALWFGGAGCQIGYISIAGVITTFPKPGCDGRMTERITAITAGADGAMWFITTNGKIWRITAAGAITEYLVPTLPYSEGMTVGLYGELWFTDQNHNAIWQALFVTASLSVSPNTGSYGTNLTFTGSGFAANEPVRIYQRGVGFAVLASATADGSGSFTVQAGEPESPLGPRLFVGVGQSSHKLGAVSFTVTPPAIQIAINQ